MLMLMDRKPLILPAHHTKHIPVLRYPFRHHVFDLGQLDNGASNGTALWLGAQALSLYLGDILRQKSSRATRSLRAIELGSGVGLSALALSAMGWDVWATDLPDVIDNVLMANVVRNVAQLPPGSGSIHIRVLDWTVSPDLWAWDNEQTIASPLLSHGAQNLEENVPSGPPFDLILSSDTLYTPDLVTPLLRALHALSRLSCSMSPPIYLCIERRDSSVIDRALHEAQHVWNFTTERIPHRKVVKTMGKGGVRWTQEDWEGVEIWKLLLKSDVASC